MMRTILFILLVAFLLLLHEGTMSGYRFLNVVHAADEDFNTPSQRGMTQLSTDGEKRHALLIAMSEYEGSDRLENPVNDVRAVESLLKNQGKGMWTVDVIDNVSKQKVEEEIDSFTQKYQGKKLLFFYTGHATQIEGENYLLPIGEKFTSSTDIKYKAIPANYILGKFADAQSEVSIIILDSCRSNTFLATRGKQKGMSPLTLPPSSQGRTKNYYIVYAAQSGQIALDSCGGNSCFTKHLLRGLRNGGNKPLSSVITTITNDVEVDTNYSQKPEIKVSSGIEFCMFGCNTLPSPQKKPTPPKVFPTPQNSPPPQQALSCEKLNAKVVAGRVFSTEEQQFFNTCGKK